jgi:hypothetical protein
MFDRLGRLAARLRFALVAAWAVAAAPGADGDDGRSSSLHGTNGDGRDGPAAGTVEVRGDLRSRWTLRRLAGAAILVALSALGVAALVSIFRIGAQNGGSGFDALCYWEFDPAHPYAGTYGGLDFSYAPPIALAFLPGHLLSFDAFRALWLAIQVAALIWLARRYALALLLFLPIGVELYNGNIHLLLAAAIVLSFRWPVAWSFVLLTKVTPGIALLWYLVRREWRSLAVALGATAAISLATMVIVPHQWLQWLEFLASNPSPDTTTVHVTVPLSVRLAASALIVVYGARTDRRWTVPVAAMVSLPVMWVNGFAMLAAIVPLLPGDLATMNRGRPATPKSPPSWSRSRFGLKRAESSEGKP